MLEKRNCGTKSQEWKMWEMSRMSEAMFAAIYQQEILRATCNAMLLGRTACTECKDAAHC